MVFLPLLSGNKGGAPTGAASQASRPSSQRDSDLRAWSWEQKCRRARTSPIGPVLTSPTPPRIRSRLFGELTCIRAFPLHPPWRAIPPYEIRDKLTFLLFFLRPHNIPYQTCDGHGSHATRNGSDGRSDFFYLFEINVTHKFPIRGSIHANINHNCTFLNHV